MKKILVVASILIGITSCKVSKPVQDKNTESKTGVAEQKVAGNKTLDATKPEVRRTETATTTKGKRTEASTTENKKTIDLKKVHKPAQSALKDAPKSNK